MPRYDFLCRVCGITFEAIVPFTVENIPCISCNNSDPNLTTLGQGIADRQLSVPAYIHVN